MDIGTMSQLNWLARMERRDRFAAAALTGLLACPQPSRYIGSAETLQDASKNIADALIAALDKP